MLILPSQPSAKMKQGNSMWWIIMETRACSIES